MATLVIESLKDMHYAVIANINPPRNGLLEGPRRSHYSLFYGHILSWATGLDVPDETH